MSNCESAQKMRRKLLNLRCCEDNHEKITILNDIISRSFTQFQHFRGLSHFNSFSKEISEGSYQAPIYIRCCKIADGIIPHFVVSPLSTAFKISVSDFKLERHSFIDKEWGERGWKRRIWPTNTDYRFMTINYFRIQHVYLGS